MTTRIPATALPKIVGIPAAPLRLLLMSQPHEFLPVERAPQVFDSPDMVREESDLEFMVRQARKLIEFDGGRGVQYLSAAEYTRIQAVWLDPVYIEREEKGFLVQRDEDGRLIRDETILPVAEFSPRCYGEIVRAEERIATRMGIAW